MQKETPYLQVLKTQKNFHLLLQKNINQRHSFNFQKKNLTHQPLNHQVVKLTRRTHGNRPAQLLPRGAVKPLAKPTDHLADPRELCAELQRTGTGKQSQRSVGNAGGESGAVPGRKQEEQNQGGERFLCG